ncbi:MAG: DegT/DnrJ/EryC1/StrS aminotransferase family protein [Pirellulales bacterium]|nr:DegT/DnrJ/EryC1/StrS aminotransferase family protein [Pirellulales bacterium]
MTDSSRLALEGGSPVRTQPLPLFPAIDEAAVQAAADVLRSGKVDYDSGQQGRLWEQEFAARVQCRKAVAVVSGRLAMEMALGVLGIGRGDKVIVSSRGAVVPAGSVVALGAEPLFADVDHASQTVTAQTIRPLIDSRTRAVVTRHFAGWPCPMDEILQLAARHRLWVIEDCSQALGGIYRSRSVGSFGHLGVFDFRQDAILTTGGEGGMVVTDDDRLVERLDEFEWRGHAAERLSPEEGTAIFIGNKSVKTKGRMMELQAAIGRAMLTKLDAAAAVRRHHAKMFDTHLGRLPGLRAETPPSHVGHAYHGYYVFTRPERLKPGWKRDRIVQALQAEGVPCSSGPPPETVYEKPANGSPVSPRRRPPVVRELEETSLLLPVHSQLTPRDVQDICRAVEKILPAATIPVEEEAIQAA